MQNTEFADHSKWNNDKNPHCFIFSSPFLSSHDKRMLEAPQWLATHQLLDALLFCNQRNFDNLLTWQLMQWQTAGSKSSSFVRAPSTKSFSRFCVQRTVTNSLFKKFIIHESAIHKIILKVLCPVHTKAWFPFQSWDACQELNPQNPPQGFLFVGSSSFFLAAQPRKPSTKFSVHWQSALGAISVLSFFSTTKKTLLEVFCTQSALPPFLSAVSPVLNLVTSHVSAAQSTIFSARHSVCEWSFLFLWEQSTKLIAWFCVQGQSWFPSISILNCKPRAQSTKRFNQTNFVHRHAHFVVGLTMELSSTDVQQI